jgi:short-subunit dehydrogenase
VAKGSALITGASSGIGAELARLCAGDGYAVILVARRADRLAELAESLVREFRVPARAIALDLAEATACEALHDQTRGDTVEILINNAGFGLRGPYTETDWNAEARMVEVNMTALAQLTKFFAKDMLGRVRGASSTWGRRRRLCLGHSWRCIMRAKRSWFPFRFPLPTNCRAAG